MQQSTRSTCSETEDTSLFVFIVLKKLLMMNTLFPGVKFACVKGNIQSDKFLLRPSAAVSTDMTKQQEEK